MISTVIGVKFLMNKQTVKRVVAIILLGALLLGIIPLAVLG